MKLRELKQQIADLGNDNDEREVEIYCDHEDPNPTELIGIESDHPRIVTLVVK